MHEFFKHKQGDECMNNIRTTSYVAIVASLLTSNLKSMEPKQAQGTTLMTLSSKPFKSDADHIYDKRGTTTFLSLTPDGERLVHAKYDSIANFVVTNVKTGQAMSSVIGVPMSDGSLIPIKNRITTIACNNIHAIVGAKDPSPHYREKSYLFDVDLASGKVLKDFLYGKQNIDYLRYVACSPCGRSFISACYILQNANLLYTLYNNQGDQVQEWFDTAMSDSDSISYSSDGKFLILLNNKLVTLCDAENGKKIWASKREENSITIVWHPQKPNIFVIASDSKSYAIDRETRDIVATFDNSKDGFSPVDNVLFDQQGKYFISSLYSSGSDKTTSMIVIRDGNTFQELDCITTKLCLNIALSSNGKYLAFNPGNDLVVYSPEKRAIVAKHTQDQSLPILTQWIPGTTDFITISNLGLKDGELMVWSLEDKNAPEHS